MTPGRLAPRAALAVALALGCASAPQPRPPPVPLTTAEPHVEPDLVGATHVVKKGETVYRIARTYGIEVRDLMEVNDLADARQLKVGMELFVPGAVRPLDVREPRRGRRDHCGPRLREREVGRQPPVHLRPVGWAERPLPGVVRLGHDGRRPRRIPDPGGGVRLERLLSVRQRSGRD